MNRAFFGAQTRFVYIISSSEEEKSWRKKQRAFWLAAAERNDSNLWMRHFGWKISAGLYCRMMSLHIVDPQQYIVVRCRARSSAEICIRKLPIQDKCLEITITSDQYRNKQVETWRSNLSDACKMREIVCMHTMRFPVTHNKIVIQVSQ